MALDEREAITDQRAAGQVLRRPRRRGRRRSSATRVLHLEPSLVALLGAGALVAISAARTGEYLGEVEWPTLVFFMGLFIMVGALVETGVIGSLAERATDAIGGNYLLASTVMLVASGVLSGIVDNIPYVATMAPLVNDLVRAGGGAPAAGRRGGPSPWAPTSAATPPPSGRARTSSSSASPPATATRSRFWSFTKYGLVVTA